MRFVFRALIFLVGFSIPIGILIYSLIYVHSSVYIEETYGYLSETVAAVLGATIALLWPTYRYWVESPELDILFEPGDNPDLYVPAQNVTLRGVPDDYFSPEVIEYNRRFNPENVMWVDRLHLRVLVKNIGQKVAKSCYASIQIEKGGRLDGCKPFSGEPKPLRWVSSIGAIETTIDIAPHGGEQALDVIFSDNFRAYALLEDACGLEKSNSISSTCLRTTLSKGAPLRAYAATPTASKFPWRRNQDGFCKGRFNIMLTVYGENVRPIAKAYTLIVGEKWNEITMTER